MKILSYRASFVGPRPRKGLVEVLLKFEVATSDFRIMEWQWSCSRAGTFRCSEPESSKLFPYGNILLIVTPKQLKYSRTVTLLDGMQVMRYTPQDIGKLIRETRKGLGVTQKTLALTSGTGLRFIIELEKGKETAEIGKVLTILQTLGIQIILTTTPATKRG
jgi:HTH-type transcriptional regulator/antitoxin HipB